MERHMALLGIMVLVNEANSFFNVKGKMSEQQMVITSELILDNDAFYDLTLGNIKACFREKMGSAKLYDRLDGNIIIGWLREFKSRLADHCEETLVSEERARLRDENKAASAGAISHAVYMEMLKARAADDDKEAKEILAGYQRRQKPDADFRRYKMEYERRRKAGLPLADERPNKQSK